MKKIKQFSTFLFFLLLPLFVGMLASFLTKDSMQLLETIKKPIWTPPNIVFPIVWTILYLLMGISSYLIYKTPAKKRNKALTLYFIQLAVNFSWSLIFFNQQNYFFALIWLTLLLFLVTSMTVYFFEIKLVAGYMQIPYILWLLAAFLLNLSIVLLN